MTLRNSQKQSQEHNQARRRGETLPRSLTAPARPLTAVRLGGQCCHGRTTAPLPCSLARRPHPWWLCRPRRQRAGVGVFLLAGQADEATGLDADEGRGAGGSRSISREGRCCSGRRSGIDDCSAAEQSARSRMNCRLANGRHWHDSCFSPVAFKGKNGP
jgi:hypothetical protein